MRNRHLVGLTALSWMTLVLASGCRPSKDDRVPRPEVQAPVQTPLVHVTAAILLVEQEMPQPPQLPVSLPPISVSQPSVCLLPLQSSKNALQAPLQTPAAQVRLTTPAAEQAVAQPPQ